NRQLATGFRLHYAVDTRVFDIMPSARGWRRVLEVFNNDYIRYLHTYRDAIVVLLLDFDQVENRYSECVRCIPEELRTRVVVLGSKDNPEALKKELKMPLEAIGTELAQDCFRDDLGRWGHPHLVHNCVELQRIVSTVKPILFASN
ncbi:MAG TPA: hypothetical protein VH682_28435, partial [Gemmataceae bacterium]